ncbi:hypothetical protein SERLADRAFT_369441 [Serpula lacrymans var. lacrymans S7.9]|uniref:DNA polymerase delta subunit 3 n=1 Tax=Serpula lacrymans var. lacrymans (strain S7.9) TaxID=578457 RepID=F8NY16_SERL9|nr:uncharacterized protein SERLADRAFT_369441 [Serpula lacrymans var. lacrymans S7.9]EGO24208.1 hypothetical protein SERLADRAFT_369441 [Serpula lacrymans var. lacrymans S7.9]
MDSEEEVPKPKPRKKSEKKVVPIGRNGLRKKRVTKSRTTTDAKGYMITEDYSSYESVDDDEPDSELPAKGKGKKKTTAETKPEKDTNPAREAPKPKADVSRASKAKSSSAKRGSLLNFFGPERGKK